MRSLVIGYGSIGSRHARLLSARGVEIAAVTRNPDCPYRTFAAIPAALEDFAPDTVVVSGPTHDHAPVLSALAAQGFSGRILVEKPLFGGAETIVPEPEECAAFVAFNLRFHPLLAALKDAIGDRRVAQASLHVGQYLPSWRPGTDYRLSYSADPAKGGGVLRDLAHELDLSLFLFGPWQRVAAIIGHSGLLEIASEDNVSLLLQTERCPSVSVTLNYLDRTPRRQIAVTAEGLTAVADLVAGTLTLNGERREEVVERDTTYDRQIAAFLSETTGPLATYAEGLGVDRLISATNRAASTMQWIDAADEASV